MGITLLSEAVGDVATVTAVFTFFIPVCGERLTAVGAGIRIYCFSIHAVLMTVPPGSSADVRAEFTRFLLGDVFYELSALFAGDCVFGRITQAIAAAE